MFKFKCVITRTGKRPVTRFFRCKTSDEAKGEVSQFLPPHLSKEKWGVNYEETRWRKSSDWCSVVLEMMI